MFLVKTNYFQNENVWKIQSIRYYKVGNALRFCNSKLNNWNAMSYSIQIQLHYASSFYNEGAKYRIYLVLFRKVNGMALE